MRLVFSILFAASVLLKHTRALRRNPKKWAAIGDSWAAGYMSGEPLREEWSIECLRYNNSYPRLFNEDPETHATVEFQDLTCTRGDWRHVNQIMVPYLDPEVELVSLTVGLGFIDIDNLLKHCDERPSLICGLALHNARSFAYGPGIDSFHVQLMQTFFNIRRAAPNAIIVWIGYPRFYGSPVKDCDPTFSGRFGPSVGRGRDQINVLMLQLSDTVRRVALMDGLLGRVYVRDPDETFANHRYCDPEPWLRPYPRPLKLGHSGFPQGYFHPTSEGQRRLKGLLKDAWQHSRSPGYKDAAEEFSDEL